MSTVKCESRHAGLAVCEGVTPVSEYAGARRFSGRWTWRSWRSMAWRWDTCVGRRRPGAATPGSPTEGRISRRRTHRGGRSAPTLSSVRYSSPNYPSGDLLPRPDRLDHHLSPPACRCSPNVTPPAGRVAGLLHCIICYMLWARWSVSDN